LKLRPPAQTPFHFFGIAPRPNRLEKNKSNE
jgi:hypothetical protein